MYFHAAADDLAGKGALWILLVDVCVHVHVRLDGYVIDNECQGLK
jgi:hypothetical protein